MCHNPFIVFFGIKRHENFAFELNNIIWTRGLSEGSVGKEGSDTGIPLLAHTIEKVAYLGCHGNDYVGGIGVLGFDS